MSGTRADMGRTIEKESFSDEDYRNALADCLFYAVQRGETLGGE